MFYTQTIGHRWGNNPVDFRCQDDAIRMALRQSLACMEVRVYDCMASQGGILLGVARHGT